MRLVPPETGPLCEVDANMENGSIEDEIAGSIAERSKQAEAVIHAEEASMPFKEGQDHYLINARSVRLFAYSKSTSSLLSSAAICTIGSVSNAERWRSTWKTCQPCVIRMQPTVVCSERYLMHNIFI